MAAPIAPGIARRDDVGRADSSTQRQAARSPGSSPCRARRRAHANDRSATSHWYRCSRCALYQRRPRSMRESSVQVASVTNAEQSDDAAGERDAGRGHLPQHRDSDQQAEHAAADIAHEDARARKIERQEAGARGGEHATARRPRRGSPPRVTRSNASTPNTKIACVARMPSMPSMKLCRLIDQTIASDRPASDQTTCCERDRRDGDRRPERNQRAIHRRNRIAAATQCASEAPARGQAAMVIDPADRGDQRDRRQQRRTEPPTATRVAGRHHAASHAAAEYRDDDADAAAARRRHAVRAALPG